VKFLLALAAFGLALAPGAQAQPVQYERSESLQRRALEAWAACIADEASDDVHTVLTMDFRSAEYAARLKALARMRVSEQCFHAMPRAYRRIRLGGLPFAGALAERAFESQSEEPLVARLSKAVIAKKAETYSYTDWVANCAVRGAPHVVARVFETKVASDEERAALDQIAPVIEFCTRGKRALEASPLALRSMLATASYRILAAQDEKESDNDA